MKKWKSAVMGIAMVLALGSITACGAGAPKEESGAAEISAQEESGQVWEESGQAQEESEQVQEESEQLQQPESVAEERESSEASVVSMITMEETKDSVIRMAETETTLATEPQGQSTSEKSEARKAYRAFLEGKEAEGYFGGGNFALLDIDWDGVEELLYQAGNDFEVYTYEAGEKNLIDSWYGGEVYGVAYDSANKRLHIHHVRRFYDSYGVFYKENGTWKGDGTQINMYLFAGEGHDGYFLSLEEMEADGYDLVEVMECEDEEAAIEAYYSNIDGFHQFVEAYGDPIKAEGWTGISTVDNTQKNRDRLLN